MSAKMASRSQVQYGVMLVKNVRAGHAGRDSADLTVQLAHLRRQLQAGGVLRGQRALKRVYRRS